MEKTTKVNVIARKADIIKGKPLDYKTFVKKRKCCHSNRTKNC